MTDNLCGRLPAQPTPRRVEWSGPEGWIVWADEDGCHLRTAKGDLLEQREVERLFELWTSARQMWSGDRIPAPHPPTREQAREQGYERREQDVKRRVIRAIDNELNPTPARF